MGGNIDLGTLGGGANANSYALDINDAGQIVGSSQLADFSSRATLFSATAGDSGNIDLGTLGGNHSIALAINNAGQIVGEAQTADSETHATLFSATPGNEGNIDLGTLGGRSAAFAINNAGQIVGSYGNNGDGFLWQNGQMYDLLDLVVGSVPGLTSIQVALSQSINDWGQIAATGTFATHGWRALLLNPLTPLPPVVSEDGGSQSKFVAGMEYSEFTPVTSIGGLETTATLLAGSAGFGSAGTYGFNREVTLSFAAPDPELGLFSDVVRLTGTGDDTFVLSLSYNPGQHADGSVALYWLDEGLWKLAVEGNTGTAGDLADFYAQTFEEFLLEFNEGVFDAGRMLGAHGSAGARPGP